MSQKSLRVALLNAMNIGILLIPGFLYGILSLLISSNILFSAKSSSTLLLLNTTQLLTFGITIAKYAADQMILSRLNNGESVIVRSFLLKRVLPLSFLYCSIIYFSNGLITALVLAICIPIEVYIIMKVVEFNISKDYLTSLRLNLLGYPFVFVGFILLSFFYDLRLPHILLLYSVASFTKLISLHSSSKKSKDQKDILLTSPLVPLQQTGNFILFRIDQLIIATNIIQQPAFGFILPNDYLFYTKITDIYSGVATSLSPVLAKFKNGNSPTISIVPLLKSKIFLLFNILAVIAQIIITFIMLKKMDSTHILLLIPFILTTLLIVPVNMLNYEYYRTSSLLQSNKSIFFSFIIAAIFIGINYFQKSVVLFAYLVPVQLASFLLITLFKGKKDV